MVKKKLGYTLNKNEFILIVVLVIAALIVIVGNYILLPEYQKLTNTKAAYDVQAQQLEGMRQEYKNLDKLKSQDADLDKKLETAQASVPDYYSQEEIVSSVNAISAQSGIEVTGINFGGVETKSREMFIASLSGKTAQPAASQTPSASQTQQGAVPAADTAPSVTSEAVTLNISGNYANLMSFLTGFEASPRKVFFESTAVNADDKGKLTGSLKMLVFGYGKPAKGYPGYLYDTPAASGRSDPFAPTAGVAGGEAAAANTSAAPDFYIILNTFDDNDNKLQMGRYPISATQIASDDNDTVKASLNISGAGAEISYSYTLDGNKYSGTLNQSGGAVQVSILSRPRKGAQDKVGVKLDVKNETNKTVQITVKNDDPTSPRFNLGATTGSVKVG